MVRDYSWINSKDDESLNYQVNSMSYLIISLLVIVVLLFWVILNMPPKKGAYLVMNSGPIVLIVIGALLTLFRRGVIGLPLFFIGLCWLRRNRPLQTSSYAGGRKSTVQSTYLEMELDHDTGEMDGRVLAGTFEGSRISFLNETDLLSLYREISDDADSVALLEAFLDRSYPHWRENHEQTSYREHGDASNFNSMSRAEAYQVLGLEPGASDEEIHRAWRRLVKAVHPDSGGSAFLTAKINAAKDLLLG